MPFISCAKCLSVTSSSAASRAPSASCGARGSIIDTEMKRNVGGTTTGGNNGARRRVANITALAGRAQK